MRVVLHGLRGRQYVAWRSNNLIDWESFAQGMTDESGFVEATDGTLGTANHRFYRWSILPSQHEEPGRRWTPYRHVLDLTAAETRV